MGSVTNGMSSKRRGGSSGYQRTVSERASYLYPFAANSPPAATGSPASGGYNILHPSFGNMLSINCKEPPESELTDCGAGHYSLSQRQLFLNTNFEHLAQLNNSNQWWCWGLPSHQ